MKIRSKFIIALFALAAMGFAMPSFASNELSDAEIRKIQSLFKKATEHTEKEQYQESNDLLVQVLDKLPPVPAGIRDPNLDFVLQAINVNYQKLGQMEAGNSFLRTRMEKLPAAEPGKPAPNRVAVLHILNNNLVGSRKFEESNAVLNELLPLLPQPKVRGIALDRAKVHYIQSTNYARLEKPTEALDALQKAVDNGFWDYARLAGDVHFFSMRQHKRFQSLIKLCERKISSIAFGLRNANGPVLKADDYKGKVLVLDVWGTWCGPCRAEIPHFKRLQDELGDQGLRIIGLTWEQAEPTTEVAQFVQEFARSQEVNYPLVMLTRDHLSALPNVRTFPTTFFIGRDGTIRHRIKGYHDYTRLKSHILPLLKEKAPAETAATGTTGAGTVGAKN